MGWIGMLFTGAVAGGLWGWLVIATDAFGIGGSGAVITFTLVGATVIGFVNGVVWGLSGALDD